MNNPNLLCSVCHGFHGLGECGASGGNRFNGPYGPVDSQGNLTNPQTSPPGSLGYIQPKPSIDSFVDCLWKECIRLAAENGSLKAELRAANEKLYPTEKRLT
jgi:hypothetical protein